MGHDPEARQWLHEQLTGSPFEAEGAETDPLMEPVQALVLARNPPDPPAHLLLSWHRLIAQSKTALRQSEIGFIDVARRSGWTDEQIAVVLNIRDQSVDERVAVIRAAEVEEHPSRNPVPWTGVEAVPRFG